MFDINGIQVALNDTPSPYATDNTTRVSVEINGFRFNRITNYSYDSDILQLGDPCAVSIPIPDAHSRPAIKIGDPFKLFMADPKVAGAVEVPKVYGLVTSTNLITNESGTSITVSAADLGWHLVNNDAPIWKHFRGLTFKGLFDLLVDPSWGLKGFLGGNLDNTRLKQHGTFRKALRDSSNLDMVPILQIEPGDKPADKFIEYAKLLNNLVNVSADGYLQLFQPDYNQGVSYKFYCYDHANSNRVKNNVEKASLKEDLSTRWTKSVCVGIRWHDVDPTKRDAHDVNANSSRGTSTVSPNPFSFNRLSAFVDSDRIGDDQCKARAKWKIQRGDFDAWTYEITVFGHSQNELFYEPNTICEVVDEIRGLNGKYYVSAVRYNRDEHSGTTTTLTIKKTGLLAA